MFLFKILFGLILINASHAISSEDLHLAYTEGLANASCYETWRGHKLHYAHFISPNKGPKDTLLFIQGRGTFLEFYEALVVPLLERNFNVLMYDLSGQGNSTRLLSPKNHDHETVQRMQHVDSFDLYVDDIFHFVNDVVLPNSEGRLLLGGYSTGGLLALRYLQQYQQHPFEEAFLISPLLSLNIPFPNKGVLYALWSISFLMDLDIYVPGAGHEDPIFTMSFEKNIYTSDENSFREMQHLCIQHKSIMMGGVSVGWVKAASDSLEDLWTQQSFSKIKIPVLLVTGTADRVVDISYNDYFTKKIPLSTHVLYPEARHEIFRETLTIRMTLWSDFDKWRSAGEKYTQQ